MSSSLFTFSSGTINTDSAVLLYEWFVAIEYDEPLQTDYVINWSYTLSDSYRHEVLLFTQANFEKVNYILTLDFSDPTCEYYLLSDSISLSAEGSFPIPAYGSYVFVIFNNDSACDILHGVEVTYTVNAYDTIPDPPIAMIVSLSIFGLVVIAIISLIIWLRLKAKHLEREEEEEEEITAVKPQKSKIRMKYKTSSSFLCANCKEKIKTIKNKCPNCNEPISCSICKLGIKETDKLYKCPYCGCIGHSEHFLEWLEVKANCPKCQTQLEPNDLIGLQLK